MARQKGSRVTEDQVRRMVELDRQGKSISAIARAVGCHRQTVKAYLAGRRGDILAAEVKKQLLTDELQKHLNDVTQFATSFKGYVTRPNSLREDRDAATVFKPLLGNDLPQGLDSDSQKARREQRQIERRNSMLLTSLREHTREQGWWRAYEEWREVWNTCQDAFRELRRKAHEEVGNRINQKPGLKEEVEKQKGKERDVMERIVADVLRGVWRTGTSGKPVEFQFPSEEKRMIEVFGGQRYYDFEYKVSEVSLGPDMAEVYNHSLEPLNQSFNDKGISEMLHRTDEKIEVIDDALDPFILRPLLVRTRCELCPV